MLPLILDRRPNRTMYSMQAIKEMIREREVKIAKIDREANSVSHKLATMGRLQGLVTGLRPARPSAQRTGGGFGIRAEPSHLRSTY
jgi:hypothetical protein